MDGSAGFVDAGSGRWRIRYALYRRLAGGYCRAGSGALEKPFRRCRDEQPDTTGNVFVLLLLAITIIGRILILDVPVLHETSMKFYKEHGIGSPPRFWDQGWIPM